VAKLKLPTPSEALDRVRETEVWKSIFRPGSIFRRGYRDTSRDRALATMNNVLYHLHPVKMKRHGLKLTYTFCLGGLSFFLFILLTITGIYLMFFYRPAAELGSAQAYTDMQNIRTSVFFGDLVRNLHRWGAHLMVFSVTLHMARVFYTGSYKPPASSTGWLECCCCSSRSGCRSPATCCPGISSRCGRSRSEPRSPATRRLIAKQANFLLLGGVIVGPDTVAPVVRLHVLALPFVLVIFLVGPLLADPQGRRHLGTALEREGDMARDDTRSTRRPSTGSWRRSSARASTDVWRGPRAVAGRPRGACEVGRGAERHSRGRSHPRR
jgi:hypothetical protein